MSAAIIPTNTAPYSDLHPAHSVLFEAKAHKGISFADIAKALGKDEVWVAAAFYGQAKFSQDEITHLLSILDIQVQSVDAAKIEAGLGEQWHPSRGLGPIPPVDPVIYRLHEGVLVYGHAIKAVLHEKFGDGIMSMVDCKISLERKADPKGDRAVLTFECVFLCMFICRVGVLKRSSGKFMPYPKW
ncbi:cyanate lyase C-terminal domain-containing protein [Roridomyces roridus]|uniref:Cyanate hydratase n=1 Tax=Roridomyces roridus TaxID=1738132 RepID=A0AAD7FK53_9AGAR|nr:cyanate lyase C-terminal domain-containing protein [Roridomyces roridus]